MIEETNKANEISNNLLDIDSAISDGSLDNYVPEIVMNDKGISIIHTNSIDEKHFEDFWLVNLRYKIINFSIKKRL